MAEDIDAFGYFDLTPQEQSSETSAITAAMAGIASGIIKVPEGVISLGAELIDLGFRRIDVEAEEGIFDVDWYYYEYVFAGDYITFDLSSFADEDSFPRTGKENDWYVHLVEVDDEVHITNISDVKVLIDSIYKIIDIIYKYK